MIRLTTLIEQNDVFGASNSITNNSSTPGQPAPIPKVLFIGDSYTKNKNSYAKKLIASKVVRGRVVAWPNINIKQLVKLTKRYINDSYTIVSVMFGDIVKQNTDLIEFQKFINEFKQIAVSYGAKLVVIQNPQERYVEYSDFLELIKSISADSVIPNDGSLQDVSTQTKIAENWIAQVNNELNIQVQDMNADVKQHLDLGLDDEPDAKLKQKPIEIKYKPDATIQANYSDSIVDQAYDLIIPFEGFTSVAKIDTDGYCRIGHGSSHITKEDGTVINLGKPAAGSSCQETYPYNISIEDAHRDLRRLIPASFLPTVERTVKLWGGDITKLNDATVAALVSVTYNYGHIPGKLKAGIVANDASMIGNALLNDFNSKGENPSRRKKEGQYILDSLDSNAPSNKKSFSTKLSNLVAKTLNIYSPFGRRKRGMHYGIDYSPMPVGSKIYAAMPGTVSRAGNIDPDGWGNTVMIDHEDGTTTLYAHLSSIAVNKGDSVDAGTYIGATGGKGGMQGAGNSEGPHLHWEYHPGGYTGKGSAQDGANVADNYFKIV